MTPSPRGEAAAQHDARRRAVTGIGGGRLRAASPIAAFAVAAVWIAAIGFRIGWWHTGRLDLAWNLLQQTVVGEAATAVATALAVVGAGVPAVVTVAVVALVVGWRRGGFWAGTVAAIAGLGQLDVWLLKTTAGRPRPDPAFGHLNSFPSGHTTLAALLATLVGLLLLDGWVRGLAALWPLAMAWSRTALGAHWLTDVTAGAVLGCATAVLLVVVAAAARRRAAVWNDRARRDEDRGRRQPGDGVVRPGRSS